jgi:transposase
MNGNALQELSRSELLALLARSEALVVQLRAENEALKARVADLELALAKAHKNSANSSKPPSSDLVKPPRPKPPSGRRHIGAQPGHPGHQRSPFPPDQVDYVQDHTVARCPACGGETTTESEPAYVLQQAELAPRPVVVTEHRVFNCRCARCGEVHLAALPEEVERAGLFGPRLTSLAAWCKSRGRESYSILQEFLREVCALPVSRGFLARRTALVSAALAPDYTRLEAALAAQPQLNVDETGHPEGGDDLWTWVFRALNFTLFKIRPSRGSGVLLETLGRDFAGVLGCDYFSAYRKYMRECSVQVQFCLAHLIRDVKFLVTLPDPATQRYGRRLRRALRRLFRLIHRREEMTAERFARLLELARRKVLQVGRAAPDRAEAKNLAERFRKHGQAYFQFITTPGLEPTNNLAERALRFIVIDRRLTQGTRGPTGRRWCERIWTAAATCAQQGRSLFQHLCATMTAFFARQPAPSLLPAGP